ncbi:MAG TPA: chalcone isomerase family protein, partial [Giesbergeria sp.]|nr:chalcone isomerase family protein [Giesbergeria sp.]
LALELTYLRSFSAQDIAQRSLQEMRRVGPFPPAQGERWQQALQAALPDVQAGDRLTGLYQPDQGVVFQKNGQAVGAVPDAAFARLFFGIWLSPQTSEPALRQALLALPATAP